VEVSALLGSATAMTKVDWLVVYAVVTIPIGALWLWVESQPLRDWWRRRRQEKARPGYVDLTRRPR
jgi:hypothetical protein